MKKEIFTPQEKALFEKIGQPLNVQPGGLIYMEGDSADKIYYIKKGRVRVYQSISSGREVNMDVVSAGQIFGESAFCGAAFGESGLRPACIQAVTPVKLLVIPAAELAAHLQKEPTLALHFLQQCSATMDRLASRLQEQCLLDRYGKVASFLLDLTAVDSLEKGTVGGVLPYTHENLADSLGLSRSTVTGVLRLFEENGWVENGYGRVKVLDRAALEEFVKSQKER